MGQSSAGSAGVWACFGAPLLVLWALFELAMWRTGESWPVSRVVDTQLSLGTTPSLYGRMLFSQQTQCVQVCHAQTDPAHDCHSRDVTRHANPGGDVSPAGAGVLQCRRDDSKALRDVATYAERLRSGDLPKPAVLIFGLDPWWVKEGNTHQGWLDSQSLQEDVWRLPAHLKAARQLLHRPVFPWQAVLAGVPSPSPDSHYEAIGAGPLFNGGGFRSDGSLQLTLAMVLDAMRDPRYKDRYQILQMVTEHRDFYTLPGAGGSRARQPLGGTLTALQHMGIDVYVFLPPFASAVQTVFETSPAWQPFWRAYLDLPARLRAAGIPCLPLSVPQQDGFDDRYMYDGHHPTEIYAAALVRQILHQAAPHSRLRTVDLAALDTLLARPYPTPLSLESPRIAARLVTEERRP